MRVSLVTCKIHSLHWTWILRFPACVCDSPHKGRVVAVRLAMTRCNSCVFFVCRGGAKSLEAPSRPGPPEGLAKRGRWRSYEQTLAGSAHVASHNTSLGGEATATLQGRAELRCHLMRCGSFRGQLPVGTPSILLSSTYLHWHTRHHGVKPQGLGCEPCSWP